ncbi:unnamed protein product, partial [Wuchereria bancrofti]
ELSGATIGYVAAINLHKIPPPIFVQYSTTAHLTTTKSPTTPLLVSTMTTVTTTQGASLSQVVAVAGGCDSTWLQAVAVAVVTSGCGSRWLQQQVAVRGRCSKWSQVAAVAGGRGGT